MAPFKQLKVTYRTWLCCKKPIYAWKIQNTTSGLILMSKRSYLPLQRSENLPPSPFGPPWNRLALFSQLTFVNLATMLLYLVTQKIGMGQNRNQQVRHEEAGWRGWRKRVTAGDLWQKDGWKGKGETVGFWLDRIRNDVINRIDNFHSWGSSSYGGGNPEPLVSKSHTDAILAL